MCHGAIGPRLAGRLTATLPLKPDDHQLTSLDCLEPRTPLYLEVGLVAVQALLTSAIAYLTRTASGLEMPSSWMLGYDTNQLGSIMIMANGKTRFR